MIYTWATVTHRGLIRPDNEDAVHPEDDGRREGPVIIAVADGMGGHVAGEVASKLAIEAALGAEGGAVERVGAANHAVVAMALKRLELSGMGTTLTLAMFGDDGELHIGHVGDSRAYILRSGTLRQITSDHSLVAEYLAAGRITPQDAARHPRRNVLTRALGIDWNLIVDETVEALEAGDRVILCTDGLTGMISDRLMASVAGLHAAPQEAAWALVEAANEAGGEDNITVAIVDVAGPTT